MQPPSASRLNAVPAQGCVSQHLGLFSEVSVNRWGGVAGYFQNTLFSEQTRT